MNDDGLRRQLGQLFVVGFHGLTASDEVKTLIRAPYYVGSIILFERNIESAEQVLALTNELQRTAKDAGHPRPLFIGIDQENGLVTRIKPPVAAQLPGAMSLGATGSVQDAIRVSEATGKLLAALGINMNYAPCCDVNSEPSNPVIGVRSPGDDGAYVGKISSAMARGLRNSNVVPCVKHFPGHGDTKVDSHYGLPVISKSRDDLEECELLPFRRASAEAIEAVMTAHIVIPSLDDSELPASLSEPAMDLLRDELQHDGVVISDCLEMDAVRAEIGTEKGAAMAIGAGTNIAMICHTFKVQVGALDEVYNASKSGIITGERISKMYFGVSDLKDRVLSWESTLGNQQPGPLEALNRKHKDLATEVYGRSVTVVRDEQQALPISETSNVVYVYPAERPVLTGVADSGARYAHTPCVPPEFADILKEANKADITTYQFYEESGLDEASLAKVSEADVVFLATRNARLAPNQTEMGLQLAKRAKKLVSVATCDPYDFIDKSEVKTILATYEPTIEALRSAARILFGERRAIGSLPVLTRRKEVEVTDFDSERDIQHVISLWHRLLPQYAVPAERLRTLLSRPNGEHFTTHFNGKLVGFIATYVNEDRPTAFISAVLVDPQYQSTGVGTALIDHARQYLRREAKATAISIGSSFPRFWPGVPFDVPDRTRSFFIHRGFCPTTGPSSRDYAVDLTTYQAPASIIERAANAGITYLPLTKDMHADCRTRQKELFGKDPVWIGAFEQLANGNQYHQAMVALDTNTGKQVGWTLMQEPGVGMSKDLAFPPILGEKTGQIGCVGVHPEARNKGVGVGLVATAAMDMKRRGMEHAFIDWTTLENWYERVGFSVWREYRPMVLKEMA